MEETLREFSNIYQDLRILSEYKVELRTKHNKINKETPKEEIDMLNADITSLYILIQEKIDSIKDLEVRLLEYSEKEGVGKDEDIEALISSEKDIVKYLYEDNDGLERYFEATVLDKNEYNEIKDKIAELERNSKRLQPKMEEAQKSFKKQSLRAEGFKEASNGKLIHPSIIEEYEKLLELKNKLDEKYNKTYTLENEYSELLDNIKEINPGLTEKQISEIINKKRNDLFNSVIEEGIEKVVAPLDTKENIENVRTIEDIEKEIEDLIKNTRGRKEHFNFCNKQYYVARKDIGKLRTLLSELRRRKIDQIDDGYLSYIKNELNNKGFNNDKTDLLSVDKLKELIKSNPDKDIIDLLIDYLNRNKSVSIADKPEEKSVAMVPYDTQYKNVAMVPYNEAKVSSTGKSIEEDDDKNIYFAKGKNDAFEPKTFDHEVKETKEKLKLNTNDLELKRYIDRVTISQINLHKLFQPNLSLDELIMFLATEEYKLNKVSPLITSALSDDLENGFELIEEDGNNKSKTEKYTIKNIKKFTKKYSKKALAAVLAALLAAGTLEIVSRFFKKRDLEENTRKIFQELEREPEKKEDYRDNKLNPPIRPDKNRNNENIENYYEYLIGSTVTVSNLPDVKIYKSTYDAKDNTNSFEPYFDYNDERVILGVTIRLNGFDTTILAYNANANKMINGLLAQGGKVVNVLVGNKAKIEELRNYNGEQMSYEEYRRCVEGWYNIEDINIKESGYTK